MRRLRAAFFVTALAFVAALVGGCSSGDTDQGGMHRARHQHAHTAKGTPAHKQDTKPAQEPAKEPAKKPSSVSSTNQEPPTASSGEGCTLVHHPVRVHLSVSEYPRSTWHIRRAIRSGEPSVLHIDREEADQHRDDSLAGIPTRDGMDRDEYPLAFTREGGEGADIAYVPYSDNRGSGSSVGGQLRSYCDGQAFRIKLTP